MQLAILSSEAALVRDLTEVLTNPGSEIGLDRAALDIARLEYPDLDPSPWLRLLDDIAFEIATRTGDLGDSRRFVEIANSHLFRTLGLRGNASDYYDIRNSCLNDVLDRRLGIPITLSLVYIEVARRLAKPVHGIGLPSHFLVHFDDGDLNVYIDPFNGGRFLSKAECVQLAADAVGAPPHPSLFLPFTARQIAVRMLQNVKIVYVRNKDNEKALRVLDLILASGLFDANEYRQRALIDIRMRRYRAAKADLETYLAMAPQADDRSETLAHIRSLHSYVAGLN